MARGGKREGAGRAKGSENKATVEFKEAVNNLINFATPKMVAWLERIAEESPDKALDHVYKFAQFGYPLLARQEHRDVDKNGDDRDRKIIIEHVKPKE